MGGIYDCWLTDRLDASVLVANVVTIDAWWSVSCLRASYWRLYRNNRAGAALKLQGRLHPLEARRVYLVPADLSFASFCPNEAKIEHFYIHFTLSGLPDSTLRSLSRQVHSLPSSPVLDALLDEIESEVRAIEIKHRDNEEWIEVSDREEGESRAHDDITLRWVTLHWRIQSAVGEALAQCLRHAEGVPQTPLWELPAQVQPLSPALRYIEEHLEWSLSNALLAQLCGLSQGHFERVFRAGMRQSPAAYLRERRLIAASQRLISTEQNLEQIARATGFCDCAHLSRAFKKRWGVTAKVYREQQREKFPISETS